MILATYISIIKGLRKLPKYTPYLLILAGVLFLLSLPAQLLIQQSEDIQKIGNQVTQKLEEATQDFYSSLFDDEDLLKRLVSDTYTQADLDFLCGKTYTTLVYKENKVVFWNNNEIALPKSALSSYQIGKSLTKLQNGYYQVVNEEYPSDDDLLSNVHLLSLQLIKYDYDIQNQYLINYADPFVRLPDYVKIVTEDKLELGTDFFDLTNNIHKERQFEEENKNITKQPAFYLVHDDEVLKQKVSWLAIYLQFISLLLVFWLIHLVAIELQKYYKHWQGFAFLVTGFALLCGLCIYIEVPFQLEQLALFKPQYFDATVPFQSIGKLLVSTFLFLWMVVFFHRYFPIKLPHKQASWQNIAIFSAITTVLLFTTLLTFKVIGSLILIFKVALEINALLPPDNETIAGIFCLAFLLIAFFLLCHKVAKIVEQLSLSFFQKLQGLAVVSIIYGALIFIPFFKFADFHWFALVWVGLLASWLSKFILNNQQKALTSRLFIWIFFFSVLAATLLYYFNSMEEYELREEYAEKIATEEDPLTEYMFEDVVKRIITEDDVIRRFYTYPIVLPQRELEQRIKKKYLSGYFEKYDIKVKGFYRKNSEPIRQEAQEDLNDYEERIRNVQFQTTNNYLYLAPHPSGGNTYLAKLPVFRDITDDSYVGNDLLGSLIIEMTPKANTQTNVYPELIIEDEFRQPLEYDEYSYALYKKGKLVRSKGKYAYNYNIDSIFLAQQNDFAVDNNEYNHLVHMHNESKTIIVSTDRNRLFTFLSLFCYLFCFALLILLLIVLFNSIFKVSDKYLNIKQLMFSSLRMRINGAILGITIVSFLAIGWITVTYFVSQSTDSHKEQLLEKQKAILTAVKNNLKQNKVDKPLTRANRLSTLVSNLSEIHSMDINLYDISGKLLSSSQMGIFDKELISPYMDIMAYQQMKKLAKSQYMQEEQIGELRYLATYVPIISNAGNILGFINIPYFTQAKELRTAISTILAVLINVYVLIFLVAGFIAVLVANSVTNPLNMIGDKLQEVKLGRKNQQLNWPHDDEIGQLVKQYNKTIIELEKSTKLLIQSEREYAWQQMARQVAHEIKNPLTPMKLSVQHLQRAYRYGADNLDRLTERVTETLIEQIDTLSGIASEFSAFAKMPKPKNEVADLRDIVLNSVTLYEEDERVEIFKIIPDDSCMIYADKAQLLRVFNNLIKNAIQAIPDTREGVLVVSIKKTTKSAFVAVCDNGSGISKEQSDKVFVPNFTTKSSGMGLGLAMSRNIVETAKGKIWFDSVVEKGTTFYIRLPLVQVPAYAVA